MSSSERLAARLESLVQYLRELRAVQQVSLDEFMRDTMVRRGIERTLQMAVEAAIDIGTTIIAGRRFRVPQTNRDVFRILAENGVVDRDLAVRLERMAGFRNVLVHEYTHIDTQIVLSVLQNNLPDLEAFADAARRFVAAPGCL